jgi:diguanylate cyclase (GGDEF)-like protein/PAS domain S-box-containing protein
MVVVRFCCLLFGLIVTLSVRATEQEVLVIHSYHQGFFWTDDFQFGFSQEIEDTNISTRVLYLDTKRFQDKAYFEQLIQLYKTRFLQEQYRAIVVSDNNALMLMNHLSDVVGTTPIIFGGINDYQPYLHDRINATGVIEEHDIKGNIALIERLQPSVESIYMISDHSNSGAAVRSQVGRFLVDNPEYQNKLVSFIPNDINQLIEFLEGLNQKSSVLFWLYTRDRQGLLVGKHQDWVRINQVTKAPLYIVHDLGLGYGTVGGVIYSGRQHGQQTARVLLEVLNNPRDSLPSIEKGLPELKLDYQAIMKWGLGIEEELSSFIFNRPLPFSQRYERELKLATSLATFFTVVILILFYYLNRIRKSELLNRESQTLLELVFDQSYQFIGVLNHQGCVVSTNRKLNDLIYSQHVNPELPLWEHPNWDDSFAQHLRHFLSRDTDEIAYQFEAEFWHAEQGALVLEISLKNFYSLNHHRQCLLEARDITSRKITEERLYQREANLSHYYDKQPVMMVTLDDRNRIQQVNQFAEQLLGYRLDSILGHKLNQFYVQEDTLLPRQVLLQPSGSMTGVWRREVEYRHSDGHILWIRENIKPLIETGHLLIVGEDITETKHLSEQLQYQAQHDVLTGTYGRNYFEKLLDEALKEVAACTRVHAMLYLDLDQLKILNDTAGHEAGDAAIVFCSDLLYQVLPKSATLARMGGDEFAILLKDCSAPDAKKIANLIIDSLGQTPFVWQGIQCHLRCSIGIRLIDHTADSPQMVHAQADTACQVAKDEGRGRFSLYCYGDRELRRREEQMESVALVNNAIANQRVELFAQRIQSLSTKGDGLYFEILARLRNAQGEYLSPSIFMPATERYNIAHLLDKEVVNKAVNWLEGHAALVEKLTLCSINLSGHSIGNQQFIEFLVDKLTHTSIPCEKICFEVTETAAISNSDRAHQLFQRLKALGCSFALDDFGSGLSSFGYLKTLPVDIVKIDGIFVRDMDTNDVDQLMVRSIHKLAKQMGKKTVAEFVENRQVMDILSEIGVDYAQGYAIGRPKPLVELETECDYG